MTNITPPPLANDNDTLKSWTFRFAQWVYQMFYTTNGLSISQITATPAEINQLHNSNVVTADLTKLHNVTATAAEVNVLHGVVAGTASASSALVLGASKNVDTINVATSGLQINSVAVTDTAAELNVLHGVVAGTATANSAAVLGASKNLDTLSIGTLSATTSLTVQSQLLNPLFWVEKTIPFSSLSSGASLTLQASSGTIRYKFRSIRLSGAGTNFSGGGGNRNLAIQDAAGTVIATVIPAATLGTLSAGDWGSTGVPYPATAAHINTATQAASAIVAKYSGGTTDYTAGSLTLMLQLEKVA